MKIEVIIKGLIENISSGEQKIEFELVTTLNFEWFIQNIIIHY